jgi:hypothetical protein
MDRDMRTCAGGGSGEESVNVSRSLDEGLLNKKGRERGTRTSPFTAGQVPSRVSINTPRPHPLAHLRLPLFFIFFLYAGLQVLPRSATGKLSVYTCAADVPPRRRPAPVTNALPDRPAEVSPRREFQLPTKAWSSMSVRLAGGSGENISASALVFWLCVSAVSPGRVLKFRQKAL